MKIESGMKWPITNALTHKMKEHSAWYSADPNIIADYYTNDIDSYRSSLGVVERMTGATNMFWMRCFRNNTQYMMHVPIANDISETSAAFLFGEPPVFRLNESVSAVQDKASVVASENSNIIKNQEVLDNMLVKTGFYQRILEGAETCSALGGVFLKLAWDTDVSPYPLLVIEQPDDAYPTFKFGELIEVTYCHEYSAGDKEGLTGKIYRHFETYKKGVIENELWLGSTDSVGKKCSLSDCEATKGLKAKVDTYGLFLSAYVPNMLPNKLVRTSRTGRSDYYGIEGLMDALDETFSDWMRDIQLAKGRVHLPESYLDGVEDAKPRFNIDQDMYVKLDVDPTNDSQSITATQFDIRSDQFEKTCLNLLDRIITSAGYSPQSFGLNIQGRAESGTALNIRERKSFSTTHKKESYWEKALKYIVTCMCELNNNINPTEKISTVIDINVTFTANTSNNQESIANSVKMLADASAISTETKVRMVHPDWTEAKVQAEVQLIKNDSALQMPDDLNNPDIGEMMNE